MANVLPQTSVGVEVGVPVGLVAGVRVAVTLGVGDGVSVLVKVFAGDTEPVTVICADLVEVAVALRVTV